MHKLAIITTAAAALAGSAILAVPPATRMILTGNGFTVGNQVAIFGATPATTAVAMAGKALGRPIERGSHGDCGQGSIIAFAKFRGGFELSFVKGRLSGWTADGAQARTAKAIGVGDTLGALRKAYPDVAIDPGDEANGGLGPSFQREGGPQGWLDGVKPGSKVTGLFDGATCIAGI